MTGLEDSDDALIGRVRAGDNQAFESLLLRYKSRVKGLALRFMKDLGEAEEVSQEVFLTVYQKINQYEGKSLFSTWLFRVAVNTALMRLRAKAGAAVVPLEDVSEDLTCADEEGLVKPDDNLFTEESLLKIEKATEHLSDEYKTIFILRDIEGFSTEETAEIMNLSPEAVKSRLHRARAFLRKRLTDLYQETVKS